MSVSGASLGRSARQLLLWLPIIALLLALSYWGVADLVGRAGHVRFTGNDTNLFAVAVPAPAEEPGDEVFTYRRLDPRGQWLESEQAPGRPLAMAAWQEDLVVQFSSGGISFFGPSDEVYQSPPAQPWRPLVMAAEGPSLLAMGVGDDGRPLFSRRGANGWDEVEPVPVNLLPQQTQTNGGRTRVPESVSETARATAMDDNFHVVWQTAVPGTPIETEQPRWLLHHAWRNAEGQWWSTSLPDHHAGQGVGLAAAGGRVVLAYRDADDDGRRLRFIQFVPETQRWNELPDVDWSAAQPAEGSGPLAAIDMARFQDNMLLAARYEGGQLRLFRLEMENQALVPDVEAPELTPAASRPARSEQIGYRDVAAMVIPGIIGLIVLMYTWTRERRMLIGEVAAGRISAEDAARQAGMTQIQRLSYLPVLFRRIVAFSIDLLLVGLMAFLLIIWLLGLDAETLRPDVMVRDLRLMMYWELAMYGGLVAYGFVTETLLRRTFGKMALGLEVTDMGDGPAAWHQVLLRNLVRPLDMAISGAVGLFLVLWSPRNQRIGDVAGHTRVQLRRRSQNTPLA